MKKSFKGQFIDAPTKPKTKDVMIGIASQLDFEIRSTVTDTESRFVLMKGYLQSESISLVNIYVLNDDQQQLSFYQCLIKN